MKVGIVGNYGHNNNGDEAILTGILHQLTHELHVNKENIIIFSNNPENTISRYGIKAVPLLHKRGSILKSGLTTIKESKKVMKNLDLLIIGGGGLLMDMYKRDAPLYSVLGMVGKSSGCKVIIYGVGAGPITTPVGKFFIKRLAAAATSISVRDGNSQALLKSIGVNKEVKVIGDPAFSVPVTKEREKSTKVKKIGVTAVPYFSEQYWPTPDVAVYNRYVEGMAKNLDVLIAKNDIEVTLYSTKFPEDVKVTEDILDKMVQKDKVTLIDDNLHPVDIVDISAEQDIIIGTRLHSLILSVVAETPVIGIRYHHKVGDFMSLIDRESHDVEIDTLSDETRLLQLVKQYEENWEETQATFAEVSQQLKNSALKGLTQLK